MQVRMQSEAAAPSDGRPGVPGPSAPRPKPQPRIRPTQGIGAPLPTSSPAGTEAGEAANDAFSSYDAFAGPAAQPDPVRPARSLRHHAHHRVPNHGAPPPAHSPGPESPRRLPPATGESSEASSQRFLDAQRTGARPVIDLVPALADKVPRFLPEELARILDPKLPMKLPELVALAWFENLDDKYRGASAYWKKAGSFDTLRRAIQRNYATGMKAQRAEGSLSVDGRNLALAAALRSNPGSLAARKAAGGSRALLGAESAMNRLEVANWAINGRTSSEIVRIRDRETQRNLLYVAGHARPFFEFGTNEALGQWVSGVVRRGGVHAFDDYFPVGDRVDTEIRGHPQLGLRKAVASLLKDEIDPDGGTRLDWTLAHLDDGNTDFMTKAAVMVRETSLQDTKKVRGAVLEKLRGNYPDFRERQLRELKRQENNLDADDLRVATQLYERAVGPVPMRDTETAYLKVRKRIHRWAEQLAQAQNDDLRQVSEASITAAIRKFRRAGQKMNPVRLANWANDKDVLDELARQLSDYTRSSLRLEFTRPAQIVEKERHLNEDTVSARGLTERQKLARQREVLEDMRRLSTATGGDSYVAIGDSAWLSAAISAEMRQSDTGHKEDILDTATHALMFQRAFDAGGEDTARRMESLMAQMDLSPENQAEIRKLWAIGTKRTKSEDVVKHRALEAYAQREMIQRIAAALMASDERLIPIALQYNRFYKAGGDGRDGAFEREWKLKETLDEFAKIPDVSLFSGLQEDDMLKARRAFGESLKGPRRPTPGEFLESAQGFSVSRQLRRLGERRRERAYFEKTPIEKHFEIDTEAPRCTLKAVTQSLADAWDNPFGELAAEVMRASGASVQDIEKAKDIGWLIINGIELGGLAPALPGGGLLAIRPTTAAILKFINRRVRDCRLQPFLVQDFRDDVSDVATVILNLIGAKADQLKFRFDRNPYMRLGP